ncbi:MAG: nitroreductase family deazaflavin-dependent oxidoreductase [Pseudomonadales bacterium]|nr:nitroreductase family deazaflavin-dependent oxidoreductase [Pseudomonadales bacterium]
MSRTDFNKPVIEEFRANKGIVGGQLAGMDLLIVTNTGAKSGKTRVNPVAYLADDDRYIIIASYAGGPKNPPWYHNLLATPDVIVEVGSEKFKARASVVQEPERSELYAKMVKIQPVFEEYRNKTSRVIPVIALSRSD